MHKIITLASVATLATLTLGTAVAMADNVNNYTSNGQVGFVSSTSTVTPTDPLDPSNPNPGTPTDPTDPTKPVQPGTSGPLSLDFASSLDFGTQKITTDDQTYQASSQGFKQADDSITYSPDYAQITDNRGTFKGWTLSVAQQGDFKTAGGAALTGAKVTLGGQTHSTAAELDGSVTNASSTTLTPDGSSINLMSGAAADTGKTNGTSGTHSLVFGDKSSLKTDQVSYKSDDTTVARPSTDSAVTLSVPGATPKLAETYTTTFQWTLGDTPSVVK